MTFQLDTSGAVALTRNYGPSRTLIEHCWSDLSPFAQGYVEALICDLGLQYFGDGESDDTPALAAFADLAPETLARIIADCAASRHATDSERGAAFWRMRQRGEIENFPPSTVQLGDDGKVRFAA